MSRKAHPAPPFAADAVPPGRIEARLDSWDGRRGGRGYRFGGCVALVEARRVDEVAAAVDRVEAYAAAGLHAVGYLAYEAAPAFDAALAVHAAAGDGAPLLRFAVFRVREPASPPVSPPPGAAAVGEWRASMRASDFEASVERVREWIAAGDSYQVNLTFRLRAALAGDLDALYARLGAAQGAAYCACLHYPDFSILSLSPELHFRWRDGEIELRPMKGTRPRGRWTAEDDALERELAGSTKDRAENLMIVDLLRNDVGRVAEWGSVRVPRLFEVERYATVLQMTSTIRARTRPRVTLREALGALFPCGSVTGAPKVRTTEIIAELECSPRGVYTGAVGFVSPDERSFNVAIRTLTVDAAARVATLGVGSGITYDSEPGAEHRECMAKAAFVRAEPREFRLLETLRHDADGLFLLDLHLERLADSARRWDFDVDPARVRAALDAAVRGRGPAPLRVRLVVARDGAVEAAAEPLAALPPTLRATLAAEPVDPAEPLLYHKTTWREPYRRRLAAHPGHDDVLLTNERGELTEFTIGNLVVRDDAGDWTPPLEAGLLPGVFRAHLMRAGRLRERVLRPADLRGAAEVFLVNSVREWCKVSVS